VATFKVAIPTPLRSYTRGAAHVEVEVGQQPPRLRDVMAALDAMFPGIRFRMIDESGKVRPHIQVFVGYAVQSNPDAILEPGDEIMLVGALSGG
jgi:hypothetical protein